MKALFTVHAGEYLAGDYINRNFKKVNLWLPSKDTGTDMLATDSRNKRSVSIQVKHSRDYLFSDVIKWGIEFKSLRACGWWTLNREKIAKSKADYWMFILQGFQSSSTDFVIIQPTELLRRFEKLKNRNNRIQCYFWVTENDRCWETHGLNRNTQREIARAQFSDRDRDFSAYLNRWEPIKLLNSR